MNTQRLNITLPRQLIKRLEHEPNKSAFIAQAVAEKLDQEDRVKREQALALAYRQAAQEQAGVAEDWDATAGDGL